MGDMLWFRVEEFDVAHNRLEELLGNGHVLITADVASHQLQVETRHHINVIIRFWIILIAIARAHTEETTDKTESLTVRIIACIGCILLASLLNC